MHVLPAGGIMQIAYVVEDLDLAIEHWAKTFGVGPFFVRRHVQYQDITYRGRPCEADVSLGFAFSGETQIELIQQHNTADSVFNDFREAHGFGQQHVGVLSDDLEGDAARLAARGVSVVQRCVNPNGVETLLFDTEFHPGVMLELIGATPGLREGFAAMKEAARSWDGVNSRRE